MSRFIFRTNPVTGLPRTQFNAKVEKIISTEGPLEFQNSKGGMTKYRRVLISFIGLDDKEVQQVAVCYENNYRHGLQVGKEYLCSAQKMPNGSWFVSVSHLDANAGLGVDDATFGYTANTQVLPAQKPVVVVNNLAAGITS